MFRRGIHADGGYTINQEIIIRRTSYMPKQKSHSGTKKRFWLTGSGKVNRPHGGKNHKAETKSSKRRRNLRQSTLVSTTQEKTVKNMMPYKD
jgi:ribosomal protein L35